MNTHGGKRVGAGRKTDDPDRKPVQYKINAPLAVAFSDTCQARNVAINATLEKLMRAWLKRSDGQMNFGGSSRVRKSIP
jgi:hypothetical protein